MQVRFCIQFDTKDLESIHVITDVIDFKYVVGNKGTFVIY